MEDLLPGIIDDKYLDALSDNDTSRLDRMRGKIEEGCVYLALAGGEAVGIAVFGEAVTEYGGADITERSKTGELYALYVLPEYQRSAREASCRSRQGRAFFEGLQEK
jgi:GNAT superfamily N-acetyltransferase